jgi:hypothetical protein
MAAFASGEDAIITGKEVNRVGSINTEQYNGNPVPNDHVYSTRIVTTTGGYWPLWVHPRQRPEHSRTKWS